MSQTQNPRNVRVTVELDIHVPAAKAEGASVDDQTYAWAEDAVAAAFNDGDPNDALNAILIVGSVEMLDAEVLR